MSSSTRSFQLNHEIAQMQSLVSLLERPDLQNILDAFDFNWTTSECNQNSELGQIFENQDWLYDNLHTNRMGRLVYARLALHFEAFDDVGDQTVGNYAISKRISNGKNSVIFAASHKILGTDVVLKFIRPGASDDIERSLKLLSEGRFGRTVVLPTDILNVRVADITGRVAAVTCLVFPLTTGPTFSEFLGEPNNHLNSNVAISFIRQVGSALEELERIGAYHGDLHGDNVIVTSASDGTIEFRLIDISFDAVGSQSLEESKNNDVQNFKHLIWRALSAQKSRIPYVSLKKFIGTKYFNIVSTILSSSTDTFSTIMSAFRDDAQQRRFLEQKRKFIDSTFSAPSSFRLQRYEEFTEPSVAASLFVPFLPVFESIKSFSNVYVSGNRGSGKSTYLAALAFFPSIESPIADFETDFGIYFPCRQGEFRGLSRRVNSDESSAYERIRHVVLLKIIRRTLEVLADGMAHQKLDQIVDYSDLRNFLNRYVPRPGIILVGSELISEVDNLVTTITRLELDDIKALARDRITSESEVAPTDLVTFFELIRKTFPRLHAARFHILFDDAGEPYVDKGVQRVINELVTTSNKHFCIKWSAERNTYSFHTSDEKSLESGHDYFEKDISHELFIGSGTSGISRTELESYFREIVSQRLRYFGYVSNDIREYVGDAKDAGGFLTSALALGRRNAYYCGWTTIWNIADRNPRNLLEIVSDIFGTGGVERDTIPARVPMREQSRAIKAISDKRLQSLSQISGAFSIGGSKISIGRKLFDVTVVIGSSFHKYLLQAAREKSADGRPIRQYLALERNDMEELSAEAYYVLEKLVTYGVLDDSRSYFARDDRARKPIYVLNRIYCPAFSIGYRRDDHLRLSRNRFEQLLLHPQKFLQDGTRRLREAPLTQIELFGYNFNDAVDE